MATETRLLSDLAVPPGEYLLEVVDELGLSQADLARRMGRPAQAINEIIKGEKAITPDTALQLEQVVGVAAHIWTGLETEYQLVKARQQAQAQEAAEAAELSGWLKGVSYPKLADFAGLPKTTHPLEKVRALRRFLGLASLRNLDGVAALRPAFRQSQKVDASQLALAVWLRRAELEAQSRPLADFTKAKLEECLPAMRAMTQQHPEDFMPALREMLAACGVAFLLLPSLPKTGVHGATFWQSTRTAVLVLTIRGAWADIFWFSLFHELAHLLLHGRSRTFLEDGTDDPLVRALEAEADAFAGDQLIPKAAFQRFTNVPGGRFSADRVQDFAERQGIHPGIVVGRLQHEQWIGRDTLNGLRERFTCAT